MFAVQWGLQQKQLDHKWHALKLTDPLLFSFFSAVPKKTVYDKLICCFEVAAVKYDAVSEMMTGEVGCTAL